MSLNINGELVEPIRVFYSKTGRAKYISHLDTMRTFTRALRRSNVPLWYTAGFNPHLYLTFAQPLSLGYEGLCESFDVRLTQPMDFDLAAQRFNQAMPMGFKILRVAEPVMEPKEIAWADYEIRLIYSGESIKKAADSFKVFDSQPVIDVVKKTKKGEKTIDIRPLTKTISAVCEGECMLLKLRMAAGIETNINPTLYLHAFYKWADLEPDGVRVVRTSILTSDLLDFC